MANTPIGAKFITMPTIRIHYFSYAVNRSWSGFALLSDEDMDIPDKQSKYDDF